MLSIQHPHNSRYYRQRNRRRWHQILRCCPTNEHAALLADLERDAADPDIYRLLPRAIVLLIGRGWAV